MKTNIAIAEVYCTIKQEVIDAGFVQEIIWQQNVAWQRLTESTVLRECAWVILSSGMAERVVSAKFTGISSAFLDWVSAKTITDRASSCRTSALKHFGNTRKIDAILFFATQLAEIGIEGFSKRIGNDPINYLQSFPYLGPATSLHLAKNLGFPVAKPDRHLKRMTDQLGFKCTQSLCEAISSVVGDNPATVDLILWRSAVLKLGFIEQCQRKPRPIY